MNNFYDNTIQSKIKRYYKWYGFIKGMTFASQRVFIKLLNPLIDYHKMLVFRKDLHNNKNYVIRNKTIEMNYLDTSNMKSFEEVVKKYSWHETINYIEHRLQADEKCLLGYFNGHICAFLWFAPGARTVFYRSKRFLIKDSDIFLQDGLTVPSYRGKGINTSMVDYISESLREKGYNYMISFVSSDNYSSIRSLQKNDFKNYQDVRFVNSPFLSNELCFIRNI